MRHLDLNAVQRGNEIVGKIDNSNFGILNEPNSLRPYYHPLNGKLKLCWA